MRRTTTRNDFIPCLERLEDRVVLDDRSAGFYGVNARFLTTPGGTLLTAAGISMGQVEPVRPYKLNFDARAHADVQPTQVYRVQMPAGATVPGAHIHPTRVAGVMNGKGATHAGIAKDARLHASFTGRALTTVGDQENTILAAQHVSRRDDWGVRAINYSYRIPGVTANGNSLVSRGLDWLSGGNFVGSDRLNVFALGNQNAAGRQFWGPPADSYNGRDGDSRHRRAEGLPQILGRCQS